MTDFKKLFVAIKENKWEDKIQLTEYLLNILKQIKNPDEGDRKEILGFAREQILMLLKEIPNKTEYKEKDLCCAYGDRILAIYSMTDPSRKTVTEEELSVANELYRLIKEARPIDTSIQQIFSQKTIEEGYIDRLISFARNASSEYEKGKLYSGLVEYKDHLCELPDTAKKQLAGYLEKELERYLQTPAPDEDVLNSWEFAADVAKFFNSDKICELLAQTSLTGPGNVSFYALESLIELGTPVPKESISKLAANPVYADLTYQILKKKGMVSLFPPEYSSPEYLAKSDLIHWLTYPTELGGVPDEIEYIGKVKYLFRKDIYYVFKYHSNSETLDEEHRGKWLIGWSSEDGGTFSNFDLLSDYEMPTVSKTLNNIKKRLIGC
jgi:hypothetical protein